MNRLTEKPFRIDSEYCYEQALNESDCKFYRFVSEVEDFLEKYNFENLEELKKFFKDYTHACTIHFNLSARQNNKRISYVLELMELLKCRDRWNKLKKFIEQFKEYDPVEADLAWKIAEKMKELEGEKDAKN